MRFTRRQVVAALLSLTVAARAHAADNGAWRTFIRPVEFTDVLATGSEVWGATAEGGLLRWAPGADSFAVIRREPGSIPSNRLTRVARDGAGRLWVGSRANGASHLDPGAAHWDVVTAIDGLPSDSVSVLEPQGDSLWIGTTKGVALWNGHEIAGALPDGFTVSFDTTFAAPRITGIAVIGDTLWLSTRRGVGHAHISSLLSDWRPDNAGLGSTDIADLASDGADLFARAGSSIYRYRSDLGRWVAESATGTTRNLEGDAGAILAAGTGGLFQWRPQASDTSWVRVADGLAVAFGREDPEPTIDPAGRLFAAAGDTLYEWSGSAWAPHATPAGPITNDVLHLALSGPRLYVTSNGRGFSRYDGAAWRLWPSSFCGAGCDTDTTFVQAAYTFVVQIGFQGRVWVGCWSPPPTFFNPGGAISSFLDFGDSQSFDHKVVVEDVSQTDRMRRCWVMPGVRDSTGRLWFGAETPAKGDVDPMGLMAYDSAGVYLGSLDESEGLQSKFVRSLALTNNGSSSRLWIGYDGAGLDFTALPGLSDQLPTVFNHITATDNLGVRGVAAWGDSVWILTNSNLQLFDGNATTGSVATTILPISGGQAVLGFQPLAMGPDGTVWAGTLSGLRAIHPGGAQDSFFTQNSPLPDDEVRSLAIEPATGAVWMTTASGLARIDPRYVPPPAPPLPALHLRLYPNPATITRLGLGLRLTGEAAAYRGEVYDVTGRLLRRFEAANGGTIWDGKDRDGHPVKPGLYLVRATAGGQQAVARVVVLH